MDRIQPMTTVHVVAKDATRFLNQPIIKEGIKKVAGSITFIFGLVEMYDICQILRGREISTELDINGPRWSRVANKIIILAAKISLILSASVTHPGVFLLSRAVSFLCTAKQLEGFFGPDTTFVENPWHPRHVMSFAAVILAIPSIVQTTCKGVSWVQKKFQVPSKDKQNRWLIDAKVRIMALFNSLTSRPFLHMGNQILKAI